MKRILLSLVLALQLLPNVNKACSCITPSSFCESFSQFNSDSNIVLRGKIVGSTSGGKEIEVHQVISGNINQRKIVLGHGMCTVYYNELEDGSEYLFVLSEGNNLFFLIGCSISFLKIENEIVVGKVAPGIEAIPFDDLLDIESCGNIFSDLQLKKNITIFPNPTSGELKIKNISPTFELEQLQIEIYDILGRVLSHPMKIEGILPEETWSVNIQDFAAGVYILRISNAHQESAIRIVKN